MKVLFSDLDGTLIDHNLSLSDQNIIMMQKLREKGHLIVLCTGRNIMEARHVIEKINFPFNYLVLNNGGQILNQQYETLFERTIDKSVGIDILKHTTSYPGMWSYFCDGKINYGYKDGITVDHGQENMPEIDKDFQASYEAVETFQIIAFNQENQQINDSEKCFQYIQEHYGDFVEPCFNTHFVDVVPKGCTKGNGVRQLLKLIHEDIDEVYAIGDSFNDLSMLREATYGYTFHHAHDDIKKQTKYHVDYVYEVIEDMLGGK